MTICERIVAVTTVAELADDVAEIEHIAIRAGREIGDFVSGRTRLPNDLIGIAARTAGEGVTAGAIGDITEQVASVATCKGVGAGDVVESVVSLAAIEAIVAAAAIERIIIVAAQHRVIANAR